MLRTCNTVISGIALSLWFGGTVALLGMGQRLFVFNRDLAAQTVPILFLWFERYQLVLAVIFLVTFAISCSRRWRFMLLILAVIAASLSVVSATIVTPRIDQLRQIGESASREFRMLHGASMSLYFAQLGILLLLVIAQAWPTQTSPLERTHTLSGVQI